MKMVIFDMDGVLVDPAGSYRRTLIEVVKHFGGPGVTQEDIVEWKNRGGFNDDGVLAHRMLRESGVHVELQQVREYGEELFWGESEDGFILGERWLVKDGVLDRLAAAYRLAVFTGRERREAHFTLNRFASELDFDPVMTSCQVSENKPHPEGLLRILDGCPEAEATYVGDNIDDGRCARAAGLPFVGIVASDAPHRGHLVSLFQEEGALAVIESVNELETLL